MEQHLKKMTERVVQLEVSVSGDSLGKITINLNDSFFFKMVVCLSCVVAKCACSQRFITLNVSLIIHCEKKSCFFFTL